MPYVVRARIGHDAVGGRLSAVRFTFSLTGAGWATATLAAGSETVELPASYISNALGDLLRALVVLTSGSTEAHCSWEEEPGEYRWLFSVVVERATLRVLWFDEMWDRLPDGRGRLVFRTEQPLVEMLRAITDGAANVLQGHGEAGYFMQWAEHSYPTAELEFLHEWLAARH